MREDSFGCGTKCSVTGRREQVELMYKPDADRAKRYWEAFWEREIIDRPCVHVIAPREGARQWEKPSSMRGSDGRYMEALAGFEDWAASTYFGGEAMPEFRINFGPDQFSAFLGAPLIFAPGHSTSWVEPIVTDWETAEIRMREEDGSVWQRVLEYFRVAAEYSAGKFLIGVLDLHMNMDCLSALRGSQRLCLDLIDCPDQVEAAMLKVRLLFPRVYDALWEAGNMSERGTLGWAPFYCSGKYNTIACDFLYLIGPEHGRRFVMPALVEEAEFLDHSVFHVDGIGSLVHLDDILAIEDIDVIQWMPGEGQTPMIEWMDLLRKVQAAGKGLQVDCTVEQVKRVHKELRPEGVLYHVQAESVAEAEGLLEWLKNNT